MFRDDVHSHGAVTAEFLEGGATVKRLELENTVVTGGLNRIAAAANNEGVYAVAAMAIGNNGTAPAVANTSLYAETGRVSLESAPSRSGASTTYIATFPSNTATGTVAELGLFDAGGTMLARVAFPAQTKESYASIRVTWVITQS